MVTTRSTRSKSKGKRSNSSSKTTTKNGTTTRRSYVNVLLYVPNLIGYLRVFMTGLFLHYAFDSSNYELAIGAYITSFTLDFFDGYFARLLNQCSKLGQVLDMVTDRVSTAVLLVVLTHLDPDKNHIWIYTSMLALDFASHWFHMRSSAGHHGDHRSRAGLCFQGPARLTHGRRYPAHRCALPGRRSHRLRQLLWRSDRHRVALSPHPAAG